MTISTKPRGRKGKKETKGWDGMEGGGRKEVTRKKERRDGAGTKGRVEGGRNRVGRLAMITVKKLLRFY